MMEKTIRSDMGYNSELFLHLRDAEVNAENYVHCHQPQVTEVDYITLYTVIASGKVVKEVWSNRFQADVVYPGSSKEYTYQKDQLRWMPKEEKLKYIHLFES